MCFIDLWYVCLFVCLCFLLLLKHPFPVSFIIYVSFFSYIYTYSSKVSMILFGKDALGGFWVGEFHPSGVCIYLEVVFSLCWALNSPIEGPVQLKSSNVILAAHTHIYVIYLEPVCPLFLALTPPKQGQHFNQNKGPHFGSSYTSLGCVHSDIYWVDWLASRTIGCPFVTALRDWTKTRWRSKDH